MIATESAVPMFDWERYETIPEVLLMSGLQLPDNRQVPLLNAHNRYDIEHQLGSARGIRKEQGEAIGRLYFARAASESFDKVKEGHVSDVSAGYSVLARTFIPARSKQTIQGREYTGPLNVATAWKLREVSLVPIGADEQAKLRGFESFPLKNPQNTKENAAMTIEQLREWAVKRGLKPEATDDDVQKFHDEYRAPEPKPEPEPKVGGDGARADGNQPLTAEAIAKIVAETVRKENAAITAERAAFISEVDELCELVGLPQEKTAARALKDLTAVRAHLRDAKAQHADLLHPEFRIEPGSSSIDKGRKLLGSALVHRALENVAENKETVEKVFPEAQREKGYEQYRYASLSDIALECLRVDGFSHSALRGLTKEQIAIAALGFPHQVGLRAGDPAYHVTASFAAITQDALNKSMQVGYTEAPSTWKGPMRQGASVPDFKTIHRYRLGSAPNLPAWPDNTDPQKGSMKDAQETYAVEAYSLEMSFSYRLIINDDMDALSRAPSSLGNAAARTVNTLGWQQVTTNPTMEDGQALFSAATGNRKRANLTTGAASPPSAATIQTMRNLMRQMRGENTPENNESKDILSLVPKYLIAPSALEKEVLELVRSAYDPVSNKFMVYNTANATGLTAVIEPLLDADSTTAYYLWASTSQIDTVEVTFLQGQESPVLRTWRDERSLGLFWAVLQTFAAKALQHRGVQKHTGAA